MVLLLGSPCPLPHPTPPLPFPAPTPPTQLRSGETAAIVAKELAEQTKGPLRPGDVPSTVRAMAQLVELLDSQLRNLTPGGKDSAARSLTKVKQGGLRLCERRMLDRDASCCPALTAVQGNDSLRARSRMKNDAQHNAGVPDDELQLLNIILYFCPHVSVTGFAQHHG